MAKKKSHYIFNSDTLSFDIIRTPLATRIKRWLYVFLAGCVTAAVWVLIYTFFFDTPKMLRLREANKDVMVSYEILLNKIHEKSLLLADIEERDNKIYRAVFEENPIPASIRKAGLSGTDRYTQFEGLENAQKVIETTQQLDVLVKEAYIQSKSFDVIARLTADKEKMLVSMPIGRPIDLSKVRLTSYFGGRSDPQYGDYRFHEGVDLAGDIGLPAYATGDGIVTRSEFTGWGYGNLVCIDHGFGYETRYGHLSARDVFEGQRVRRGDKIGELGNTGKSSGPHLHYEVRLKGSPMNPLNYFENNFNKESNELLAEEPTESTD